DDVSGADVADDGRRHHPDRAGPGDEDVLSHDVEGEGGVGGVAERVEHGGDVVGDVVGQRVHVLGGQHEVVGERSGAAHPHRLVAVAELASAGPAVAAVAAGDVTLPRHALALPDPFDFVTDRGNASHELVADHEGDRDRRLRPFVPFVDVEV